MELFNANVSALQLALQKTPEVFESVGVDLSVKVAFGVVNDLMFEVAVKPHVAHQRIGVDRAACLDVGADSSLEKMLFPVANNGRANLTTTFQHPHDGDFVFG